MAIRVSVSVEEINDKTDDQLDVLVDHEFSIYNRYVWHPEREELAKFRQGIKKLVEDTFIRDDVAQAPSLNEIRKKMGLAPLPESEDDGTVIRMGRNGKAEVVDRNGKVIGAQG